MARKGCYVCHKLCDKFYILKTPEGQEFKLCSCCFNLTKGITKDILNDLEKEQ